MKTFKVRLLKMKITSPEVKLQASYKTMLRKLSFKMEVQPVLLATISSPYGESSNN